MNSKPPPFTLQPLRPSELAQAAPAPLSWLWHGYLAAGKVTALVSPPKVGKTTLLSHVLARMAQGGPLAGLAVAPGRALVVSEEASADWDARCRQRGIGPYAQGIDCARMRTIAVKSAVHFRSGFEPIAGSIHNVNAQAIHTHDFAQLPYRRRRRPRYPLERV